MTTEYTAENTHAYAAQFGELTCEERQIEATLAVAYEQRTANLIALWIDPKTAAQQMSGINYGKLAIQIRERLGLQP